METEDPVLQRDLFRSREKDVKQAGIASVAEKGDEGYNSRVEEAKRLFEQARVKQDPSRFQTLSEQEKPGVFRPVQASATQMPQPNVQQQMAQMQAMGFRPVGMAGGGYVAHMREGGMTPTVAPVGEATSAYPGLGPDPMKWTDEEINAYVENMPMEEAASPAGRTASGILSLDPKSVKERKARTLRNIREQAKENQSSKLLEEIGPAATEARKRTEKSIFEPATPQEYEQSRRETRGATEQAVREKATELGFEDLVTDKVSPSQTAGGSGDYMRNIPSPVSDAQVAGGSGDYMRGIGSMPDAQVAGGSGDYMKGAPSSSGIAAVSPDKEAEKSNVFDTYSTNLEKIKADRAAQRQENINLALMQAGLAIAGGTSANALTNIGQGGISGLQAFGQAERESRADFRQAQQDLRSEQERARDEAFRREGLGLQQRAQKFKEETEFPENVKLKEATLEAARIGKQEAIVTNTARLYGQRIDQIDNRLNDLKNDFNTPEDKKTAEIERLMKERDGLIIKWNALTGNTSVQEPQEDYTGFTLKGVK